MKNVAIYEQATDEIVNLIEEHDSKCNNLLCGTEQASFHVLCDSAGTFSERSVRLVANQNEPFLVQNSIALIIIIIIHLKSLAHSIPIRLK